MSFLLAAFGLLMVVSALYVLATRRRRRTTARRNVGTPQTGRVDVGPAAGPWTRSDRIALASLVVGTVLGVLGFVAR